MIAFPIFPEAPDMAIFSIEIGYTIYWNQRKILASQTRHYL
jgi:hypothetical protein